MRGSAGERFASEFLAVLHHNTAKIRKERGVFLLRERAGTGQNHEGMAGVFGTVGRVNVQIRIGDEASALVEALAATGNGVDGRVDLEDDRLAYFDKQAERRRA